MPVVNPYLKSNKRTRQHDDLSVSYAIPADQRQQNQSSWKISSEKTQNSRLQSMEIPKVGRNLAQASVQSSLATSSKREISNDGNFDDSGIDWEAAIQIMDQTTHQRVALMNKISSSTSSGAGMRVSTGPTQPTSVDQSSKPLVSHIHKIMKQSSDISERMKEPLCLDRPSQWENLSETNLAASVMPKVLQFSQDRVQPVNDEYRQALVQNANLSATLNNGWTLYSHQKRAILKALLMRRCILALDCGLGKTIIGCVWAKSMRETYGDLRIFVICPVSMTQEWRRTAVEATGLEVAPSKLDKEFLDSKMQIFSWSKVPTEIPPSIKRFVIVCDEAHSMQSMGAQRTKSVLKLIGLSRCVGVLLLSGTPMKNGKPSNLFPLLKAVKHPFGEHQKAFETYFCAGQQKQIRGAVVWDATGSSNLRELNERISSHLLYMRKEDVLADLPPQTRETRKVPVSSRHQLQHNQALSDLARIYNTKGSLENSGDAVLTAVQKVRMIGSFAKIDATVGLAKEVLQDQPAIVIFTSFAQVAKAVHKQLADSGWEGVLLTGETPSKKRQGMVDNFQQGLNPVFVSTFGAGGVGLTLTAAQTIILLDRPWTPGDAKQAEDRVRRIGQTKPVRSIWMAAFDLDKQIDDLLEQKKITSDAVLTHDGNQERTSSAIDAPKISIFQLLRSILVPNS